MRCVCNLFLVIISYKVNLFLVKISVFMTKLQIFFTIPTLRILCRNFCTYVHTLKQSSTRDLGSDFDVINRSAIFLK